MKNAEPMLDKIVRHYVISLLNKTNSLSKAEIEEITKGIRSEVIRNTYQNLDRKLLEKAKKEAFFEKQKILNKFKINLIIETLFIAFLVGLIVNQVTNFIDNQPVSFITIIISLLLCVIFIFLNAKKV